MVVRSIKIRNKDGILLDPAGKLVGEASRYRARVMMVCGDHTMNCKSLISLLAFPVRPGDEVTLECDGKDEEEALDGVYRVLERISSGGPEQAGGQI